MNLISSLAHNIRSLTMEDPAQPLQPYSVLIDMLGMTVTDAGILVNEKSALRQTAVLRCVLAIAQGLSSLPLGVYERQNSGKRRATEHRLYPILHDQPNPQMSSMVLREGCEAQRQLWGNAYCEIQRDKANRPVAIWPLPSDQTNAERVNGELRYVTTATPTGARRYIDPKDMIHVPGLAFDGISGLSPIQLCKQTIGHAMAIERFGAQFFGNGVRPSGAFVVSNGKLNDEARENLRKSLQSAASGINALRPLLLENGVEWKPMSVPPNEAQFVEAIQATVPMIARIFGVPLHIIQDLTRATNNNIEQQALEFVMYRLRPDAVRWEQELNRKLFSGTDYFCEHSMSGLLRGDFKTRMEGYSALFQVGGISPNMIAELENWNTIPEDEGGDLRFVPMNMIPLESAVPSGNAPNPDNSGDDGTPSDPNASLRRSRVIRACRPAFQDAVRRTLARNDKQRADALTVRRIWEPAVRTMAEMIVLCRTAQTEITEGQARIAEGWAGDVYRRAGSWQESESAAIIDRELREAYQLIDAAMELAR